MMLYFYIFGLICLAILTYQDVRTMTIDSRINYFMFGVVALMLALKPSILPLLAVIVLIPVKKSIGSGDVETLLWVLAGLSMNPKAFITFGVILTILVALNYVISKKMLRIEKSPGLPLIFISFLTAFIINGIS